MPGRVEGKVALVTGAAAGQGAAHARLLAHEGASVLCLDVALEAGAGVAAEIIAAGGEARFQPLDVGDPVQWEAAVALATTRYGRIDGGRSSTSRPTWASLRSRSTRPTTPPRAQSC